LAECSVKGHSKRTGFLLVLRVSLLCCTSYCVDPADVTNAPTILEGFAWWQHGVTSLAAAYYVVEFSVSRWLMYRSSRDKIEVVLDWTPFVSIVRGNENPGRGRLHGFAKTTPGNSWWAG
jgi:hypothetical protein